MRRALQRLRDLAVAATLVLVVLAPSGSSASERSAVVDSSAVVLPKSVPRAATEPASWIIGAAPGRRSRALGRRYGAQILGRESYLVSRAAAGEMARALRRQGKLLYAEPNGGARSAQATDVQPIESPAAWRDAIVPPRLTAPTVTPTGPRLGLIDTLVDTSHPAFAAGNVATSDDLPVIDGHGTALASIAAATGRGGLLGVWPGMRILNLQLPDGNQILCSQSVRAVERAVRSRFAVISMAYGSLSRCLAEYRAVQRAIASGIVVVAAAGNDFGQCNPGTTRRRYRMS